MSDRVQIELSHDAAEGLAKLMMLINDHHEFWIDRDRTSLAYTEVTDQLDEQGIQDRY